MFQRQLVALPAHFHEEDQVVVVLRGRRRVVVGGKIFAADAGGSLHIHAGTVHCSLAEDANLQCMNVYLTSGQYVASALCQELSLSVKFGRLRGWEDILPIAEGCRISAHEPEVQSSRAVLLMMPLTARVSDVAKTHGISREHYSRQFQLLHGVSVQANPTGHRIWCRRNHGRCWSRHRASNE